MIVRGDARKIPLRDQTVQCVVTSPPYFQLRDYQCGERQIGLEATPEAYIAALIEVFREVHRVLRHDGVLWLVLGDSYWGTRPREATAQLRAHPATLKPKGPDRHSLARRPRPSGRRLVSARRCDLGQAQSDARAGPRPPYPLARIRFPAQQKPPLFLRRRRHRRARGQRPPERAIAFVGATGGLTAIAATALSGRMSAGNVIGAMYGSSKASRPPMRTTPPSRPSSPGSASLPAHGLGTWSSILSPAREPSARPPSDLPGVGSESNCRLSTGRLPAGALLKWDFRLNAFRAVKRPFIPPPSAAARYLVWMLRPKGAPYGVSRVWVGLSRLGAEPLLRRRRWGAVKNGSPCGGEWRCWELQTPCFVGNRGPLGARAIWPRSGPLRSCPQSARTIKENYR